MFEVTVSGRFRASHQLRRANGECEPLHAHDWQVRVTYVGPRLSAAGWLIDFGVVREHLLGVLSVLESAKLNEVPALRGLPPSAETIALYVAEKLPAAPDSGVRLAAVEVEEEPGCVARYCPAESRSALPGRHA